LESGSELSLAMTIMMPETARVVSHIDKQASMGLPHPNPYTLVGNANQRVTVSAKKGASGIVAEISQR